MVKVRDQGTLSMCAQQERPNQYILALSVSHSLLRRKPPPPKHHLLIRRDRGTVQCVFNCVFVIKITNENKMGGQQQHKFEEPIAVKNTLHICNHLVETQISSREPLSNIAWPTGRVFIHCSTMRMGFAFSSLP